MSFRQPKLWKIATKPRAFISQEAVKARRLCEKLDSTAHAVGFVHGPLEDVREKDCRGGRVQQRVTGPLDVVASCSVSEAQSCYLPTKFSPKTMLLNR